MIMFDTNRELELTIPSPDGGKTVAVRFPTDDQWIERMRKLRTVVRTIGRGKTSTEIENSEEVDSDLVNAVRINADGPALDGAEASAVIDRISRADADEAEREGSEYRIRLRVPGAVTLHRLRMPSQKEILDYRRSAVSVLDGRRRQEIRINLRAAGDLYDKLKTGLEGYAGDVPIVHKSAVVSELLATLRNEEDDEDEGF